MSKQREISPFDKSRCTCAHKMSAKLSLSSDKPPCSLEPELLNSGVQWLLYYNKAVSYLRGGVCIRPMGVITGLIAEQDKKSTWPRHLRRSRGNIQLMLYKASDKVMKADYDSVMDTTKAPSQNANSITLVVRGNGKVSVFGEAGEGFSFMKPTMLELSGHLQLGYWAEGRMVEEPLYCSALIEVIEGDTTVYVCDDGHIVVMYDQLFPCSANPKGKFYIKLVRDNSKDRELADEKLMHDAKTIERITETLSRLKNANKDSMADEKKPKCSNSGYESKGKDCASDTNKKLKAKDLFDMMVKRVTKSHDHDKQPLL